MKLSECIKSGYLVLIKHLYVIRFSQYSMTSYFYKTDKANGCIDMDRSTACHVWKSNRLCESNSYVKINCRRTCEICFGMSFISFARHCGQFGKVLPFLFKKDLAFLLDVCALMK